MVDPSMSKKGAIATSAMASAATVTLPLVVASSSESDMSMCSSYGSGMGAALWTCLGTCLEDDDKHVEGNEPDKEDGEFPQKQTVGKKLPLLLVGERVGACGWIN